MIKIDFSSAISIYLCLSLLLVFILWIFYNYYKSSISSETKYLQQCPYCTYIFFNYNPKSSKPEHAKGEDKIEEDLKQELAEPLEDSRRPAEEKGPILVCPRCQSYINLKESNEKTEMES